MSNWLKNEFNITPHNPDKPRHQERTTRPSNELYRLGKRVLPDMARLVVPRVLEELANDPERFRELYQVTYQPFGDEKQGRGFEVRVGEITQTGVHARVRLGMWPSDPEGTLRLYQGRRGGWMKDHGYGNGGKHKHGYAMASLPVRGTQRDKEVELQPAGFAEKDVETEGDIFRVYRLNSHGVPGQNDHLITDGQTVKITKVTDRAIPAGQIYTMSPELIHAVTNERDQDALTISLNGDHPPGNKTLVYFRGTGESIEDERLTPTIDAIGNSALKMIYLSEKAAQRI